MEKTSQNKEEYLSEHPEDKQLVNLIDEIFALLKTQLKEKT